MGGQGGLLPDYDVAKSGQAGTAGLAIAAPVKIRVMAGCMGSIEERQTAKKIPAGLKRPF